MDVNEGFLGNATGGIGQGLAYVLPNSRTEAYAIQLNQERAAQQRAAAAALAKQQEAQNDEYAKHVYQNIIPEHDAKWDNYIQGLHKDYTDKATKFHADTGKDSYVQPEFVKQRNEILSAAKKSQEVNKTAVAIGLALQNDKDNKLDPADKQAAAQWLLDYQKDPIKAADTPAPSLMAKSYDITDAQKLLKPVETQTGDGSLKTTTPNRHAHVVQAQEVLNDPKFDQLKIKAGINPNIGDVFSIEDTTGTHYPTDEPTLRRFVKHILDAPELPGNVETLKVTGIDPADPNAEQKLLELGMKQNKGYGELISGLADYADNRVNVAREKVFTADNNKLAHERLGLARSKAAGGSGGGASTPIDMRIPYLGGKANVDATGYVPLSIPKKNFAGTAAYNLTDGKKIPSLESSDDYSMVGVGNFPFIIDGAKLNDKKLVGTVAQPNFVESNPELVQYKPMVQVARPETGDRAKEDVLVDYNKLPENIRNSKAVREALGNFKPAQQNQQSQAPKKAPKVATVTSEAQYNALPAGSQYIAPNGKLYRKK